MSLRVTPLRCGRGGTVGVRARFSLTAAACSGGQPAESAVAPVPPQLPAAVRLHTLMALACGRMVRGGLTPEPPLMAALVELRRRAAVAASAGAAAGDAGAPCAARALPLRGSPPAVILGDGCCAGGTALRELEHACAECVGDLK